jgi:prepilin-type N-terminal cleavage/methylation domain-containing protein
MNKLLAKKEGFTLIEVVLVLAIAGLILVVVFLAVGGANRANRDVQRTNEAGQIAAALESYARNNNGNYPLSTDESKMASYLPKDFDTQTVPKYGTAGPTKAADGESYASGQVCNAAANAMVGGGVRNYAILYWSEQANGVVCKDNK